MKKCPVRKPKPKSCPICAARMKRQGQIRVGPKGGKRVVYACPICPSKYKSL